MSFFQLFQYCLRSGLGTIGDFSSEQLLHGPQSATKLLRHYPQMGYFRQQNNLRLSPYPPIKGEVSVAGSLYSDTTLLGGGGGEEKLHFSPFKVGKTSQRPIRTKCLNKSCRRLNSRLVWSYFWREVFQTITSRDSKKKKIT